MELRACYSSDALHVGILENLYTLEIGMFLTVRFGTLKLWVLVDNPAAVWCLKLTWCRVKAFTEVQYGIANPTFLKN